MKKIPKQLFAYKNIVNNDAKNLFNDTVTNYQESFSYISKIKNKKNSQLWSLRCKTAIDIQFLFDYLGKTSQPIKKFNNALSYIIDNLKMSLELAEEGWYKSVFYDAEQANRTDDRWVSTKKVFNMIWPVTTTGNLLNLSSYMAKKRLEQIIEIAPWFVKNGDKVCDVGCGPARYLVELKNLNYDCDMYGIDSGDKIIDKNKERFSNERFNFFVGDVADTKQKTSFFDVVLSIGVLHHSPTKLEESIKEHFRILKPGGRFFIFIVGDECAEMSMWAALRDLMEPVPQDYAKNYFEQSLDPIKVQGMMDHCYGEYFLTSKDRLISILENYSSKILKIPGVEGLDVTPMALNHDNYFNDRYGEGQHRYLCIKD